DEKGTDQQRRRPQRRRLRPHGPPGRKSHRRRPGREIARRKALVPPLPTKCAPEVYRLRYFGNPNAQNVPSYVPRYSFPFASDSPLKWLNDVIVSPLDHNSFPVCASSANNVTCPDFPARIVESKFSPISGNACFVSSPLPNA